MAKITKTKVGRPAFLWTKEKIALLKKLYPNKSNEDVATTLAIDIRAVRNAAMRFKIKKSNRYWDNPEEKFVLHNWEVLSPMEIAEALKKKFKVEKTKWAVINKYRELKGLR